MSRAKLTNARRKQRVRLSLRRSAGGRPRLLTANIHGNTCMPRDALNVKNEGHPPVAHDGAAGINTERLQDRVHGLDDDLFGVEQLVDDQAETLGANLDHGEKEMKAAVTVHVSFSLVMRRREDLCHAVLSVNLGTRSSSE